MQGPQRATLHNSRAGSRGMRHPRTPLRLCRVIEAGHPKVQKLHSGHGRRALAASFAAGRAPSLHVGGGGEGVAQRLQQGVLFAASGGALVTPVKQACHCKCSRASSPPPGQLACRSAAVMTGGAAAAAAGGSANITFSGLMSLQAGG